MVQSAYRSACMRLYRRYEGGFWYVQARNKRTCLYVTDRKAAELAVRELDRRHADPTYRPPDPSATLKAELAGFIQRQREKGRAPGTIAMYELHARSLAAELGAETPIAQVDAAAIERFVSARTKAGASKSYRWKELCTLRGALKRARRHGRYPFGLDQVMPDDAQPVYVPLTRHLLLPDVRKLLAELDPERRAVVAFIVATAADLGSVWRAEREDFQRGFIRVRGSKTVNRHRVVPILEPFAALARMAQEGFPFAPWGNVRRDLARACKRAGVAVVTARDLRRSHGRILRAAGVVPSLIGPMLGHAPGSPVTALAYAQLDPAELGALIEGQLAQHVTPRKRNVTARRPRTQRRKAG